MVILMLCEVRNTLIGGHVGIAVFAKRDSAAVHPLLECPDVVGQQVVIVLRHSVRELKDGALLFVG